MNGNPLGLDGIAFVEFSTDRPEPLKRLFRDFGFSRVSRHAEKSVDLYRQGKISFLLNSEPGSFGDYFFKRHGPSISSMGWRVSDPVSAHAMALARGARDATGDYVWRGKPARAIYGIGDSLVYFVEASRDPLFDGTSFAFLPLQDPELVPDKGFVAIDHLTNNVYQGTMREWAEFYQGVFGFTEVRYFDIRGKKTGLTSYALRSPCGKFCIPINEAEEKKSQINEYLEEYRGPGVQHLAFLTKDLLRSLRLLEGTGIQTLDIEPDYYRQVFQRVPNVREDHAEIERLNVLVDGDEQGYLLQIFTKNVVGPIFIELIQRENHLSFGEGNFQALFNSIERDQMRRGVIP